MNNLNPTAKLVKSNGVDLPVMTVYLAGRISGDCIEKCLDWRKQIINYYKDYKGKGQYPISFLCPLNSGEAESVDEKGLTSSIPPNLIYDKDILSVEHADVLVANMDDFFEEDIKSYLNINKENEYNHDLAMDYDYKKMFFVLQEKILKRRPNLGTPEEIAIARYLKKPIILIVPENQKYIFEKHPFQKRASVIVSSVEQLIEEKWLNILYKSIAGAIY